MRRGRIGVLAIALVLAVSITSLAGATADREPNETYATAAGPMAEGEVITGTLEPYTDVDWFYFYVGADSTCSVSLGGSNNYIQGKLYQWDGGKIREHVTLSSNGVVTTTLAKGLYYVRLSEGPIQYQLRISGDAVTTTRPADVPPHWNAEPVAESGETHWSQAVGPMKKGTMLLGTVSGAADEDWFYFYNSQSTTTKVGANLSGIATIRVYEYRNGALLQRGDVSDTGVAATQLEPGLYYIRVTAPGRVNYEMSIWGAGVASVRPAGVAAHGIASFISERNETTYTAAAGPIASGRTYIGKLETDADADWYRFYVSKPGDAWFGCNIGSQFGKVELFKYNGGSLELIRDFSKAKPPFEAGTYFTNLTPGAYFIKVSGAATDYDLTAVGPTVGATKPRATVYAPTSKTKVRRYARFGVSGYLSPRHVKGASSVIIVCQRKEGTRWVQRKTVRAVNDEVWYNGAFMTKYTATVSLPSTGTWRLKAVHSADVEHNKATSYAGRSITVTP